MLLKLFILRLIPMICFMFCKDRRKMKHVFSLIVLVYVICFLIASWEIFRSSKWLGIVYIPIAVFPHGFCYAFSLWLLLRCLWREWSYRVWRRIYWIAFGSVVFGIYLEKYFNPVVLQFFCKILHNF